MRNRQVLSTILLGGWFLMHQTWLSKKHHLAEPYRKWNQIDVAATAQECAERLATLKHTAAARDCDAEGNREERAAQGADSQYREACIWWRIAAQDARCVRVEDVYPPTK